MIYGTAWKEERTEELTWMALRVGVRGIDTANQRKHYYEAAVGHALVRAAKATPPIRREQLFLQSKFTHLGGQDQRLPYDPNAPVPVQVAQSFESSLVHLHTDYLDGYLLHGPSSRHGISTEDWAAWHAMQALHRQGKTRLIGVSNVSVSQLEALCASSATMPALVQNRCYARDGWDREVRTFCTRRGILYQGFSLLTANRRELSSPVMLALQQRTGRKLAELVFAFATQSGICVLTGTTQESHLRLDLGAVDLVLDRSDLVAIENIAVTSPQ